MMELKGLQNLIKDSLRYFTGGELFLEKVRQESVFVENGVLKFSNTNVSDGFGLRGFFEDQVFFFSSDDVNFEKISDCCDVLAKQRFSASNSYIEDEIDLVADLYPKIDPSDTLLRKSRIDFSKQVYEYIKDREPRFFQIQSFLTSTCQDVTIIKPQGILTDKRPLATFYIMAVIGDGQVMRQVFCSNSLRDSIPEVTKNWQRLADEIIRKGREALESRTAPAGELPVVFGPGSTGILLHEAVGHGLEADFNRKKTSVFTDKLGSRVAADCVTIVDDGTVPGMTGSLNFDDEGNRTRKNILIENGVLVNYLSDNLNSRLMGVKSSGSGRRQNFRHHPLPRMNNTFMMGQTGKNLQDLLLEMDRGIFVKSMSNGEVDITSGQFVFEASEAYFIENGKISYPLQAAMLIGMGSEVLQRTVAVANDLDFSFGSCGKDGQTVPVGVGQPSVFVSNMTVGGKDFRGI